ncbi:hypothetical protein JQC92_18605, partial [Shewanella sp. 202IG2-18]|nr:hypothetical protein [Parashewanella hymeniacidonis]
MRVYYSLYGRLLNKEALYNGYRKVRKAKGAAGIDGQSLEHSSYADTFQREVCALKLLGFTNLEVMQSLTINAASFPMVKGNYGLVKIGYESDLLLFNKNPLEDLTILNKPKVVIQRGKVVLKNAD